MKNLLLIGKIPPPIGGVTIHVSRLLQHLQLKNTKFAFYDLNSFNTISFFLSLRGKKIAHLHSTHPILQLLFVLSCRFFRCKSIITIHGNMGVHNKISNYIEFIAIKISNIMLFLNQESYAKGVQCNKNSYLTTSFIPPVEMEQLPYKYQVQIKELRQKVQTLFCTNAYNLAYDIKGKEIYGITDLINVFEKQPSKGIIISDPSGKYYNLFKERLVTSNNIIFLPTAHSFYEVIKLSDCLVRYTTTDGDSVSIREALYLNMPVIASDCVDRPKTVILIESNNIGDLEAQILKFKIKTKTDDNIKMESAIDLLETIYFNTLI